MDQETYLKQPLGHEFVTRSLMNNRAGDVVIFDVGACDGLDSMRYASNFPSSKVYSFEPEHANFAELKNNIAKFSNIKVEEIALSSENEEIDFFSSFSKTEGIESWNHGNKSGSTLPPADHLNHFPNIDFRGAKKVMARRLDSYCKENMIQSISLLHIDVQGAELEVLKGATDMMEKVDFMWLEVSNVPLYENQPLKEDIERSLGEFNFLKILDRVGNVYGDQLYINRDYFRSLDFLQRLKIILRKFFDGLF